MSNKDFRILLVDDQAVDTLIGSALTGIGVIQSVDQIDFRRPNNSEIRFGCELPEGEQLDAYDLALIDLELLPIFDQSISRSILIGGSEVLPYLREVAPWLPVIAESRLFKSEANLLLPVALSFGFDGHFPQGDFGNPNFNRRLWDSIFNAARESRRRAVIGDEIFSNRKTPTIQVSEEAKEILESSFPDWQKLFVATFCYADKLIVESLTSGFSGAKVFKVRAVHQDLTDLSDSEWVMKVSKSPSKLHQELRAHHQMVRYGLDHARIVPLLWPGVLVESRLASIAYKFATGTKSSSDCLTDVPEATSLLHRLSTMFLRFYRNRHLDTASVRSLVNDWFTNKENLSKALSLLDKKSSFHAFLEADIEAANHDALAKMADYGRCRIHGDLHFGNIMLGDAGTSNDLLIDFANSRIGPVALDAAKLVSDILIRIETAREKSFPSWEATGCLKPVFVQLEKIFTPTDEDKALFNVFLALYLAESLAYDDVDTAIKTWIIDVLNGSNLF